MQIVVTHHAVEQYRSRWAPALTLTEARDALVAMLGRATRERARSPDAERWVVDADIVLLVRPDHRERARVVVTVLPYHASRHHRDAANHAADAEMRAIAAAHAEDMAAHHARLAADHRTARTAAMVDCEVCGADATHYSHRLAKRVCGRCRAAQEAKPCGGKFHSIEWYRATRGLGAR